MMQMGPRQGEASTLVTIKGGSGTDTILHLVSKKSVVWDLRDIPQGRIKGVLLYTSEPNQHSGVVGISDNTPVEYGMGISGRYNISEIDCLKAPAMPDLNTLPLVSKAMNARFGKVPSRMFASSEGDSFDLDDGIVDAVEVEPPHSDEVRSLFPVTVLDILPGEAGIKQLVAQGSLKPFTSSDVQSWMQKGGKLESYFSIEERIRMQIPSGGPEEIRTRMREQLERHEQNIRASSGYLVTSNITLPSGFRPSPANAIVLAPGVNVTMEDERLGMMAAVYRLSGIQSGDIRTSGAVPERASDRPQFDEREGVESFHANWNQDKVEISFPGIEMNSANQKDDGFDLGWILATVFGFMTLGLGVALGFMIRRK